MSEREPYPNHDIEVAIIGAMLAGGAGFADEAITKLRPRDFLHPTHRTIFQIIRDLRLEHELPADVLTVAKFARENGKSIKVSYLSQIEDMLPVNIHADPALAAQYFGILRKAGNQSLAAAAVRSFESGKLSTDELIEKLREIDDLDHKDRPLFRSMADEIRAFRADMQLEGSGTCFDLGLGDLDNIVKVYPGNMICVAGDTSMGKSTIAMQIIQHVARQKPVLFASIEMVARELILRMIKIKTGVSDEIIMDPEKTYPDMRERVYGTFDWLGSLPIEIMDVTRCDPSSILRAADGVQKKHGDLGLIVIDYIQRMPWPSSSRSDYEATSKNSTAIKDIAMDTKVPTIAVSQINRTQQHERRLPMLQDLRNSGRIAEDADTVIMIGVTPRHKDEDPRDLLHRLLLVRKQRHGPTGIVTATFNKDYVRYENIRAPERT